MSKPSVGLNGRNTPMKAGYPTLGGVYGEKIKKGYVTRNGKWELCWSGNIEFTYTGKYKLAGDPSGHWELALLTDGELNFSSINSKSVDVFLVGGGQSGGAAGYDNPPNRYLRVWGGDGGGGGEVKTEKNIPVTEGTAYPCVIGQGGSTTIPGTWGSESTAFGKTSAGGKYTTGGYHALALEYGGGPGQDGFLAFGTSRTVFQPGHKYGASASGAGSVCGSDFGTTIEYAGASAQTDGAAGGYPSLPSNVSQGGSAPENSGNGSGGQGIGGGTVTECGTPGTGIIIVRPHGI